MVDHGTAMLVRANRSEIANLPPSDQYWRETPIDESVRQRLADSGLIERDDETGLWHATRRLEEYMWEKYGVELDGGAQSTLGSVSESPHTTSRARADGGRDVSESPCDRTRQVALDGSGATERVRKQERAERGEEKWMMIDAPREFRPKHEAAKRDDRQATIDAYRTRGVCGGRLVRPAGSTYSTPVA